MQIGEWGKAKQLINWLEHTVGLDPLLNVDIVDVMCNRRYDLLPRKMPRAVVAMLWDGDKRVSVGALHATATACAHFASSTSLISTLMWEGDCTWH